MTDSLTPTDTQNEPSPAVSKSDVTQLSPEELVAKSIAPVNKSYLLSPPLRRTSTFTTEDVSETKSASKIFSKDKKSKRQLKRERRQEQKSALHLCPEIAKSGDVSSCIYKDNCRFSHDVEAFKAQKPADLEGSCPFSSDDGVCPYGLACRFAGTLKGVLGMAMNSAKKCSEVNGLSKDVQKLLWKNKMCSPKADATLKRLGLLGKGNKKKLDENDEVNKVDLNGAHANVENSESVSATVDTVDYALEVANEEDGLNGAVNSDENRPFKKAKPLGDTELCSAEAGPALVENSKEVHKEIMTEVTDSTGMDTDISLKLHPREKKLIDFRDKLYLAPLTTVGNLPFRRVCKVLGTDVTCGEMAMCTNLLQGQASEWALLRRHSSDDLFGVQICGAYPDTVARAVELIEQECTIDFIDINMGCPIDIVVNKGAGSALLTKPMRMKGVIQAASGTVEKPITVKLLVMERVRTGYFEGRNRIDSMIEDIGNWGAQAIIIHGRSRQQRYSKLADWEYINQCAKKAPDTLQVLGNGDIFSFSDWNKHKSDCSEVSTCMIARGALIKPWIFTEIKEQRHWDISSAERLNILKDYVHFGLQHWGSDTKGVETTRHFLLEWLSYTYRYVPVGLLDVIPQKLNWRPPSYFGRDDLETLMASDHAADWVRISEILLGKVPDGFTFAPKHKSNTYGRAENG